MAYIHVNTELLEESWVYSSSSWQNSVWMIWFQTFQGGAGSVFGVRTGGWSIHEMPFTLGSHFFPQTWNPDFVSSIDVSSHKIFPYLKKDNPFHQYQRPC